MEPRTAVRCVLVWHSSIGRPQRWAHLRRRLRKRSSSPCSLFGIFGRLRGEGWFRGRVCCGAALSGLYEQGGTRVLASAERREGGSAFGTALQLGLWIRVALRWELVSGRPLSAWPVRAILCQAASCSSIGTLALLRRGFFVRGRIQVWPPGPRFGLLEQLLAGHLRAAFLGSWSR